MPSKSQAQHNLMEGVAHGWKPRGGKAPPVKVAKEFAAADKGKKFGTKHVADALRKHKPKATEPDEPDSETEGA